MERDPLPGQWGRGGRASTVSQYEIRVSGELCGMMLAAFPEMTADVRGSETVLEGVLPDQAALYSVLEMIDSLNLSLLEVRRSPAASGGSK
jgi:hypothetical protein